MYSAVITNYKVNRIGCAAMKRRRFKMKRPRRVGAAVVEFAVVAPLLFLLTLGMMEVSRMVMVKQLLVNASREGARLAVLPGTSTDQVKTLVSQELTAASVKGVEVQVQPANLSSAVVGTPITVTVNVAATSVSWLSKPLFSFNKTLNASTTMRKESL